MEIILLLLFIGLIIYWIIKFFIFLIKLIIGTPKPKMDVKFREQEKSEQENLKISTPIFRKEDFPGFENEIFYFLNYYKNDGQKITKDDEICLLKIGDTNKRILITADEDGFLEHTKIKYDIICENETLYLIHIEGQYKNENNIKSENYFHYVDYKTSKIKVLSWNKKDGDFVNKDEIIFSFREDISYFLYNHNEQVFNQKAEKSGYLDIITDSDYLNNNELICVIRENDNIRIKNKFINEPIVTIDEFSNTKIIRWENVSFKSNVGFKNKKNDGIISYSDDEKISLFFTFNYFSNNDYIIFRFDSKQIKLQQNDIISIMFENSNIINFSINPIFIKDENGKSIIESKSFLSKSDIELFTNYNFHKWKISQISIDKVIFGGNFGEKINYYSKNNLCIVIKKFANDYLRIVSKEIENYKPKDIDLIIENNSVLNNGICYVYLMKDLINGFYKIGISNNPSYREKTLQSEKPSIELLASKQFPIRKFAESFEKSLHNTFSNNRIRGEWFDLSIEDVNHLIQSLK